MKPTALLVNTSRAELIEPGALVAALHEGRPGKAAVDVFEHEPLTDPDDAVARLPNALCTPHLGYVERDNYEFAYGNAFDQIAAFARGSPDQRSQPRCAETGCTAMNLELDGKVVLITGGSKGIGLACARAFGREGARVAIVSRSEENLDAAKAALGVPTACRQRASPPICRTGVRRRKWSRRSRSRSGPIAVLVNSAGGARRVPPGELTPDKWRAAMDAKFFTYMNVMDYVLPRMVARRAGAIVNIVGTGGKIASPMHLPGGAANAALMLASAGLAAAWGSAGVRVNVINPAATMTERLQMSLEVGIASMTGKPPEELLRLNQQRIPAAALRKAGRGGRRRAFPRQRKILLRDRSFADDGRRSHATGRLAGPTARTSDGRKECSLGTSS